ncbi:unnamed protein product [Hymenolepis diminuta]|uniref:Ubiquitin-like domain-containing protein n=1 Tax=Hymenolepis diminuta TaxID=6216 RepID=A0A564Y7Q3_HYMDI|nr:unnamed protein product [Hymenolepis diminuta]
MELHIVTLTGSSFELRVSPNDTVMSIKSKIQRFEGIPIGQQHLIWQNDELSDHQSLRDCSIPGGATLRLVLGMRGGPSSTYRPPPTAATATVRFTPAVHFASSSANQKKTDSSDSTDDLPTTTTNTSVPPLNENKVHDQETQKQITFYFVHSADRSEFMQAVDKHHHRETASTNSLPGSENSSECSLKASPLSSNLLSNSKATQSLPFLQSEASGLSCCGEPQEAQSQLPATTSEPSLLKASSSERQKASSSTTIAAAASLFAGYVYGQDNPYASDTEDCLLPECNSSTTAAAYFLRPPSPEWDNQDLSTTSPVTVLPFFPPGNYEGEDYALEEDNDSLADLKDCLIYYQSGDLFFGPKRNGSYSYNWRENFTTDADSPLLTQAKVEECETLAEKMRYIRSQLSQQKQKRIRRRLRHHQQQGNEEDGCKSNEEIEKSFAGTEPRLPSLSNQGSSHKPKIRYRGDQGFRTVHLSRRHPVQATVSAVDLSSTELSNTSPTPSIDNLTTLLQSSSRRQFLEPPDYYYYFHQNHKHHHRQNCHHGERFRREAAPNKTTSETNLDAAAIIPGFSGYGHFSQHRRMHTDVHLYRDP